MIITEEIIEAGKSSNGGWRKRQLRALGLPAFWGFHKGKGLRKGWKKWLVGKDVPEINIKRFLGLKNKHLNSV